MMNAEKSRSHLSDTVKDAQLEQLRQLAYQSEFEKACKQREKRERRRYFAMKFRGFKK
jgi:cation transport regulator ChaB